MNLHNQVYYRVYSESPIQTGRIKINQVAEQISYPLYEQLYYQLTIQIMEQLK